MLPIVIMGVNSSGKLVIATLPSSYGDGAPPVYAPQFVKAYGTNAAGNLVALKLSSSGELVS